MRNKVFFTPEHFNERSIRFFLENIHNIFLMAGKQIPNVFFDVSKTKSINIIGQLLIYKFMEYSFHKECFYLPKTNINTKDAKYINSELRNMGFKKLVDECFTEHSSEDDEFIFQDNGMCFVSPIILEKGSAISGIGKENEKKISNYYKYDKHIPQAVLSCIGEIASNFQEHAEDDTRSVLVAKGDKKHFEIACADTGAGIIHSLWKIVGNDAKKPPYNILRKAMEIGVSSKLSEGHMGCGLWIVNEYVTRTKGYMCIYSENGYLINKMGKIKCGESPFWKGTIIFVDISLTDTKHLHEVLLSVNTKQYV